jgi:hypothetical protein
MRIQTILIILLALLALARVADLCASVSAYRVTTGLLSLGQLPGPVSQDPADTAALRQRKQEAVKNLIQSGVEILMLAGVGVCFAVLFRRRQLSAQRSHEASTS